MLDNLTGSESAPGDPLVGEFVWTRQSNAFGWSCYLGDHPPSAYVPARVASRRSAFYMDVHCFFGPVS